MSIQAMAWVLEHSQAEGLHRLVLMAIANHADQTGTNAFPSVDQIAREARVHRATVYRALPALVELGELEIRRGGSGPGATNLYRVLMRGSHDATGQGSHGAKKGSHEPLKKGRTGATQTVIPRTELHAGAREALPVGEQLRRVGDVRAMLASKAGVR